MGGEAEVAKEKKGQAGALGAARMGQHGRCVESGWTLLFPTEVRGRETKDTSLEWSWSKRKRVVFHFRLGVR